MDHCNTSETILKITFVPGLWPSSVLIDSSINNTAVISQRLPVYDLDIWIGADCILESRLKENWTSKRGQFLSGVRSTPMDEQKDLKARLHFGQKYIHPSTTTLQSEKQKYTQWVATTSKRRFLFPHTLPQRQRQNFPWTSLQNVQGPTWNLFDSKRLVYSTEPTLLLKGFFLLADRNNPHVLAIR